jgi:hypothetical protein
MNTIFRTTKTIVRFVWLYLMQHREALGVALGSGLSFSLYSISQLWPIIPAFIIGLFIGPLVTALVAKRHVILWGALTNSLLIVFCWLFPIFLFHGSPSEVMEGFSRAVSLNWFPYMAALFGVQAISLFATLPVTWHRFSRSRYKLSHP